MFKMLRGALLCSAVAFASQAWCLTQHSKTPVLLSRCKSRPQTCK